MCSAMLLLGAALSTCGSIDVTSAARPITRSAASAGRNVQASAQSSAANIRAIATSVCLFTPELMGERALVGARRVADAFARCPHVLLVIERDDAAVRHGDLGGLLQQLLALRVVHCRQALLEQRIHLRIRVAAAVGRAHALVF